MAYMSQLSGKSVEELADELRGVIFQLPNALDENGSPSYVTADEYLSGNVRQKLAIARRAAEESEVFRDNVEALEKAQPKDLDASEIDVRLGATWIDKKYIQEFMEELLQPPFYLRRSIVVNYSPYTAEWSITGKKNVGYRDVNACTTYGTWSVAGAAGSAKTEAALPHRAGGDCRSLDLGQNHPVPQSRLHLPYAHGILLRHQWKTRSGMLG